MAGFSITKKNPLSSEPAHKFAPSEAEKHNWLKNSNIQTVLDIGANVGHFATRINSILPWATIYSFEPLRSSYEQLVFACDEIASFSAFPFALGDEDGETTIYHNAFSPSSSMLRLSEQLRKNFPFAQNVERQTVEVRRLDDVVSGLDLRNNLLIKIDVQGFEDRVIRGGLSTIRQAKILIVETSFERLYDDQPIFDDIYTSLRRMGFSYNGAFEQLSSPLDGRALQQDSIFVRD